MDEIELYRQKIVNGRRSGRQLKTKRRRYVWRDKKPKFFDTATVLMFLALIGFGLLLMSK